MDYVRDAVLRGQISGDGSYTERCRELLEHYLGVSMVLLTSSGTHALEMASLLLRINQGDEVIVPAFAFVSTVNAFVLHGAKPVFADIRGDTLNIDEKLIAELITPRTKAVVPVHYAGVACEMDEIAEIAGRAGVAVVEDNAHGLFGRYRGRNLGALGCLAAHSFHETKNIMCGEGGALIVNDERYADRAEIIREKGTDRNRFFRGEVDKYTWRDVGSSYVLSDLLAAFLLAQLEEHARILTIRQTIWKRYSDDLNDWAGQYGVSLPSVPRECEQSYHMFYLLMPSCQSRDGLIAHLKRHRIQAVTHYTPLHLSKMGRHFGGAPGDCPITEDVCSRLVRLPFYLDFLGAEQTRVIDTVMQYKS